VLSRLAGRQPETLRQSAYAQCISLGRSAGIYQFANRSDVAVWLHIGDGLGARIKEFVCKGIPGHLAKEAHKPGSFKLHRLPGGAAKRRQLLRAEATRPARPAGQRQRSSDQPESKVH
jgi:NADH dehydrogenase